MNKPRTFAEMFPDIVIDNKLESKPDTTKQQPASTRLSNKAATELISMIYDDERKTKKTSIRFKPSVYCQLQTVCKKKL